LWKSWHQICFIASTATYSKHSLPSYMLFCTPRTKRTNVLTECHVSKEGLNEVQQLKKKSKETLIHINDE